MRQELKWNSAVQLSSTDANIKLNFTIDQCIDDGSTCLVYEGTYSDGQKPHRAILKELYPVDTAGIVRNSHGSLVIPGNESKRFDSQKTRFISGYETHVDHWNENDQDNATTNAIMLLQGNNTWYILEDYSNGTCYGKVTGETLKDILEVGLSLAKAVDAYHRRGLVHLDIKPQNIYRLTGDKNEIKLFDFDSVRNMTSVQQGKARIYSSKSWAAQELRLPGKFREICEATDYYSIGAVIFSRIMRREVSFEDSKYHAEYEFDKDNPIFENITHRIYYELKRFFRKTLSCNVKRRYQDTSELQEALRQLNKLSEPKVPYLIDNRRSYNPISEFIGRRNELGAIHEKLSRENVAFIHGMGGMGKTELAKKYCKEYGDQYHTIQFIIHEDESDVQTLIDKLQAHDLEEKCKDKDGKVDQRLLKQEKKNLLSRQDEGALIVIDNLDVTKGSEELKLEVGDWEREINTLIGSVGKAKVLFTTRSKLDEDVFRDRYLDEIDTLNPKESIELFCNYYKIGSNKKEQYDETVKSLLRQIQYHPLLIKLVASTLQNGRINLTEMLEHLENSRVNVPYTDKVKHNNKKRIITEHIRAVFDLSNFLDEKYKAERYALTNMGLIPNSGIDKEWLKEWCELEDLNAVTDLVQLGWINEDEQEGTIWLHPIISDLINDDEEFKPKGKRCKRYLKNLSAITANTSNRNQLSILSKLIVHAASRIMEHSKRYFSFVSSGAYACERARDYRNALKLYKTAVKILKSGIYKKGNANEAVLGRTYGFISEIYLNTTEYKKALIYAKKSLKKCSKLTNLGFIDTTGALISQYDQVIRIYTDMGDEKNVWHYCLRALKDMGCVITGDGSDMSIDDSSVIGANKLGVGDIYEALARFYATIGNDEKVKEFAEKAVEGNVEAIDMFERDRSSTKKKEKRPADQSLIFFYRRIINFFISILESDKALVYLEKYKKCRYTDKEYILICEAVICGIQGNDDAALNRYNELLSIVTDKYGDKSAFPFRISVDIAMIYHKKEEYEKVIAILEKYKDYVKDNGYGLGDNASIFYMCLSSAYFFEDKYDIEGRVLDLCIESLFACKQALLNKVSGRLSTVYDDVISYYYSKGDFATASVRMGIIADAREKTLGIDHEDTTKSYFKLGEINGKKSDYSAARRSYEKCLAGRKKLFGEKSEEVGKVYFEIGRTYIEQRMYKEAIENTQRALEITEKVFGYYHEETAWCYNHIGYAYAELLDYKKFEEYEEKSLEIHKQVNGYYHIDTAASYQNVAYCLNVKGEYSKAVEYYQNALEIRKKVLGDEDERIADSYIELAKCYYGMHKYSETIDSYLEAVDILAHAGKPKEKVRADILDFIADINYNRTRNYSRALEYYIKAYKVRKSSLGNNHKETLYSFCGIANSYYRLKKYQRSLFINSAILNKAEKLQIDKNKTDAIILGNIGKAFYFLKKYNSATEYFEKSLLEYKAFHKVIDEYALDIKTKIADSALRLNKFEQALNTYEIVLAERKKNSKDNYYKIRALERKKKIAEAGMALE